MKCSKCHEDGHRFQQCPNEWVCNSCKKTGHRQSDCPANAPADKLGQESAASESDAGDSPNEATSDAEQSTSVPNPPIKKPKSRKWLRSAQRKKSNKPATSQASMDRFVNKTAQSSTETSSKRCSSSVTNRSPPTPVDVLHDGITTGKKNKKQ